jgi:ribosome-interacting GTPase 1
MPANLPPQYHKAEADFRRAAEPSGRLEALREMFRLLPKHKGTEKLQSDLKQKISRAKEEVEGGGAGVGGKKGGLSYRVPREGAGQVVILGAPNAGKSALVGATTRAQVEVAAYPFTTRAPQPGMAPHRDVMIQLVDMPPITAEYFEPWVSSIVRHADLAILLGDLSSDDVLEATQEVIDQLAAVHTRLVGALPSEDDTDEGTQFVRTIVAGSKGDVEGAVERLELVREVFGADYPVRWFSSVTREGLDSLMGDAYDGLGVVRIYTKVPGKPADRAHPFTIPVGSTVADLAHHIHRDLGDGLKSARVWGTGVFEGQTVKRDHELHDADVVELHV